MAREKTKTMFVPLEGQGACDGCISLACSPLPEPLEAWISIMSDAVPFIKNVFVVCPSTMGKASMLALRSRCRQIFPTAQIGSTRVGFRSTENGTAPPHFFSSSSSASALHQRQMTWLSPLDVLPAQSQDIIVFVGNVFGREMLCAAPSHITSAHRVLQPHGILAVLGYPLDIRVTSPSFAVTDTNDFLATVATDLEGVLQPLSLPLKRGTSNIGSSHAADAPVKTKSNRISGERRRQEEARTAKFVLESLSSGHADVYFPFPATSRRWFQSEYALSPLELAACYRSLPSYAPCYSSYVMQDDYLNNSTERRDNGSKNNAKKDFVSLPFPHGLNTSIASFSELNASSLATSVIVRRPPVGLPLDPLDLLLQYWQCHRGVSSSNAGALRTRVLHFVLTCSYRGVNALQPPSFSSAIASHVKTLLQTSKKNG